jgi:hypothetical protein
MHQISHRSRRVKLYKTSKSCVCPLMARWHCWEERRIAKQTNKNTKTKATKQKSS